MTDWLTAMEDRLGVTGAIAAILSSTSPGAPHQIADTAKHQRAERPHEETRREGEQRKNESGRLIDARKELLGDNG